MLLLSKSLLNRPVMSLRSGGEVAITDGLIINPNNLKIEGLYVIDRLSKERLILITQDVRDITQQGIIIDDHEVLAEASELIRLKPILELQFELIGKTVKTVAKERVGKVDDFAADDQTLHIQKLYVGQSLLKSLTTGQMSVDRNQIVEITNRKVVIKEPLQPTKQPLAQAAPAV